MRKFQLLHVDDDSDDHEFLTLAAQSLNDKLLEIVWKKNGEEAVKYLSKAERLPDAVILDMNMPKMDGITTLQVIKKSKDFAHLPVYMFSTSSWEREQARCRQLGAIGVYTKPHSVEQIEKFIQQIIVQIQKNKENRR